MVWDLARDIGRLASKLEEQRAQNAVLLELLSHVIEHVVAERPDGKLADWSKDPQALADAVNARLLEPAGRNDPLREFRAGWIRATAEAAFKV